MNSRTSKRSNSELDYAPPWARERARPPRNELTTQASRDSDDDDRACYQRALPELVPDPPAGTLNIWPIVLRLGLICLLVSVVAAASWLVIFNSRQNTHNGVQANASPLWATSENRKRVSAEAVRIGPGLADDQSPVASTPPPQRPQRDSPAATAPGQTIASTPTPNQSPLNVNAPPSDPQAGSGTSAKAQVAAIPEQQLEASPADKQPLPKRTVTLDDNEIQMLIKHGNNLLKDGDFAAARLVFERAANAGSAEAALALGSTYDPSVIRQLGALSVSPDLDRALKWYQTAADRGSANAAERYANLTRAR